MILVKQAVHTLLVPSGSCISAMMVSLFLLSSSAHLLGRCLSLARFLPPLLEVQLGTGQMCFFLSVLHQHLLHTLTSPLSSSSLRPSCEAWALDTARDCSTICLHITQGCGPERTEMRQILMRIFIKF